MKRNAAASLVAAIALVASFAVLTPAAADPGGPPAPEPAEEPAPTPP